MKKTVKTIVTLLSLTMFLIYTSGLRITVHHCCHRHHHETNDHRHCTENTYIFKITDQYDSDQGLKKSIPTPEISTAFEALNSIPVASNFHEPCVERCHCLFHAVHRSIFHIVSQLIL